MLRRRLTAYNTATASENRIHDDATAQRFGFTGGLVPGVCLHAYLAWGPAAAWGMEWLTHGSLSTRYRAPTYDGSEVTTEFDEADGACRLRSADGTVLADGVAALPDSAPPPPDPDDYPVRPLPSPRPTASPEYLTPGRALGSLDLSFPDDVAVTYLDDVREVLDVYRDEAIAHPGWVLRLANTLLKSNLELGPWIHASSRVQHHDVVRSGAAVDVRARVDAEYERSGHRFVDLDVAVWADGAPVATILHTAIYLPRQVREAAAASDTPTTSRATTGGATTVEAPTRDATTGDVEPSGGFGPSGG